MNMEGKNAERRRTGRKHPRFHQFISAELIPHHSGVIFPFQSSRGGEGRVVLRYARNISYFLLTPMISIQFLPCINFYQMDTGLTIENSRIITWPRIPCSRLVRWLHQQSTGFEDEKCRHGRGHQGLGLCGRRVCRTYGWVWGGGVAEGAAIKDFTRNLYSPMVLWWDNFHPRLSPRHPSSWMVG